MLFDNYNEKERTTTDSVSRQESHIIPHPAIKKLGFIATKQEIKRIKFSDKLGSLSPSLCLPVCLSICVNQEPEGRELVILLRTPDFLFDANQVMNPLINLTSAVHCENVWVAFMVTRGQTKTIDISLYTKNKINK